MTLTDFLLIAALAVFVVAWWVRRTPARRIVQIAAAAAAVVIGVVGYLDDRWQNLAGCAAGVALLAILGITVLKNRLTRTDRTGGVPFITGIPVVAIAAIPVVAILTFPVWQLPKPSGQYAVGVRSFEIDDASRKGVFAAKPDEPRRLLVRVWYPAQSVSGSPAPYFTAAETQSTARSLGAMVKMPFFFTYIRHVKTNSYPDAPLLKDAADLPVVFYSHGYTSYLNQNTALMEELASNGYVVFSIQHTYDSADTAFPNGDVAPMDPELLKLADDSDRPSQADALAGDTLDKRIRGALVYQEYAVKHGDRIAIASTREWVADRLFLHDTLQSAPPKQVADIAQASNLDHVGEAGMSFGGAVTGEICMFDARCAAGVNMDGGNFPFSSFNADIPSPFLMLHSDIANLYESMERTLPPDGKPRSFNEFSYERIATAGSRPDVYRVSLKGSQHLGLSDSSLFVGPPIKDMLFGTAPAETMIGAQNVFIRGFFDEHLRGIDNGFPASQLAAYEGKVVTVPNTDLPAWWNAKPEAERVALEARINAAKPRRNAQTLVAPTPQ